MQQAAEGLVWTGLGSGDAVQTRTAALVFLFFALAFWPEASGVPFCAFLTRPAGTSQTLYGDCVSFVGVAAGLAVYIPSVRCRTKP